MKTIKLIILLLCNCSILYSQSYPFSYKKEENRCEMDNREQCGKTQVNYAKIILLDELFGVHTMFLQISNYNPDYESMPGLHTLRSYMKMLSLSEMKMKFDVVFENDNKALEEEGLIEVISKSEISVNITVKDSDFDMFKNFNIKSIFISDPLIIIDLSGFKSAITIKEMNNAFNKDCAKSTNALNSGQKVKIGGTIADAVDLGLSVKWASHNIGAAKQDDIGLYFSWGEIQSKNRFDYDNYTYIKKVGEKDKSRIDQVKDIGENICGTEYDAATQNWGTAWRMPTHREISELLACCKITRTMINGVAGYNMVGPNGNSIFLPAAGIKYGIANRNEPNFMFGKHANYWCGESYKLETWPFPQHAYDTAIDTDCRGCQFYEWKYYGLPIRPVVNE